MRLHEASPWTEQRVSDLKAMHAEGLSYSQIGNELKVSRNAAIGKANRLGLPPREKKGRPRVARAYPKHRKPPRVKWQPSVRLPKMKVEPMSEEITLPFGKGCSLLELSESTCRWPIGDPALPDFQFCGGDSITGLSYCPGHARMAYRREARR